MMLFKGFAQIQRGQQGKDEAWMKATNNSKATRMTLSANGNTAAAFARILDYSTARRPDHLRGREG